MSAALELLRSKKFIAMIAAVVAFAASRFGLEWSMEEVVVFMSPIVAFILAQGQADKGKEAAKISAAAGKVEGGGVP